MRRRSVFIILWLLATIGFAWLVCQGHHKFDSPFTLYVLIALLACTVALMGQLPNPAKDSLSEQVAARRGWFIPITVLVIVALFVSRTVAGPSLLFAWPILATGTLVCLRPKLGKRQVAYGLALAVVAGVSGLGAGWVPLPSLVWGVLQSLLVFTGLLAGWALLRHTGLYQDGVGHSQLLDRGPTYALRSFGIGALIAVPWALGIVLLGAAASQAWVQSWYQPFMAISAGIGEEVWGRVFPIPFMFLLLSQWMRPRRAYVWALIVVTYWFAYLHASGGIEGMISTVMIGTLYSLPLAFVCLHRDLETAIGFHFSIDFVKFVAALMLNTGLWFG